MHAPHLIISPFYAPNIPMIDRGFDRFEGKGSLAADLREAGAGTFYHSAHGMAE